MAFFLGIAYLVFVFGPAAVVYFMLICKKPETNLLAISSAFTWLLSVMPPSLFDGIKGGVDGNSNLIPLFVVIAVACQELGRFLYVKTYMYADSTLRKKTKLEHSLFSDFTSAISSGFGIGVFYALVVHGGAISATFSERKDGDFYDFEHCSHASVYFVSAVTALMFQPFHIALSLLTFHYFRRYEEKVVDYSQHVVNLFKVFALHLLAALASCLNQTEVGCALGLPLMIAVVLLSIGVTYKTISSNEYIGAPIKEN